MRTGDGKVSQEMIKATCIFPCPGVDEAERQRRLNEHRKNVWGNGCIIESETRIHNPVFDKKGEKTTTKMVMRPARTDDEIAFIISALSADRR